MTARGSPRSTGRRSRSPRRSPNGYARNSALRIADLDVGQRSIRVDDTAGFEPGTSHHADPGRHHGGDGRRLGGQRRRAPDARPRADADLRHDQRRDRGDGGERRVHARDRRHRDLPRAVAGPTPQPLLRLDRGLAAGHGAAGRRPAQQLAPAARTCRRTWRRRRWQAAPTTTRHDRRATTSRPASTRCTRSTRSTSSAFPTGPTRTSRGT